MKSYFDSFPTPFGLFSIAVDANAALNGTAFGGRDALAARLGRPNFISDRSATRAAREQILAYCAGDRTEFTLAPAPRGTPFQLAVWTRLLCIPYGTTQAYGRLAADLGRPGAARAVGRANATNPICLVVPCHRVIGADGSLTGFAFGATLKRRLLEHEGALPASAHAA
jgi:methylated-DNA-[protein]-cysteine S-methyltransferase